MKLRDCKLIDSLYKGRTDKAKGHFIHSKFSFLIFVVKNNTNFTDQKKKKNTNFTLNPTVLYFVVD